MWQKCVDQSIDRQWSWLLSDFIQRLDGVIPLGLVGHGADGLTLHAVLGIVAEKVYKIGRAHV